jgi:hypothetical protein
LSWFDCVNRCALSTSIAWSGIGDDNKINANEMAATTLSGIVETIGTVTSISISSIAFNQGNTAIHTIRNNLPSVNSDNNWTLGNDSTWISKLTQGDYTVTGDNCFYYDTYSSCCHLISIDFIIISNTTPSN